MLNGGREPLPRYSNTSASCRLTEPPEPPISGKTVTPRASPRQAIPIEEQSTLEICADRWVTRNTHSITVESHGKRLMMRIENIRGPETPRIGKITALSPVAAFRRLAATLQVGSQLAAAAGAEPT